MITFINRIRIWLNTHCGVKQWIWFVTLWLGGLLAAWLLTYPIKLLISFVH